MSISKATAASHLSVESSIDSGTVAADAFDDLVWTDREVCNHCFSRPRRVDPPEPSAPDILDDQIYAREDGARGDVEADCDDYGAITVSRPIIGCTQCGSTDLTARYDTLATSEAIARIPRLAARIRDHGIPVDEPTMYDVVRRGKQRESLEAYDRELFEAAVRLGIKHV